jgi:hypothetical protein
MSQFSFCFATFQIQTADLKKLPNRPRDDRRREERAGHASSEVSRRSASENVSLMTALYMKRYLIYTQLCLLLFPAEHLNLTVVKTICFVYFFSFSSLSFHCTHSLLR